MRFRTFLLFLSSAFSISGLNVTIDDLPIETLVNLTDHNDLWTSLLRNCEKPSLSCVKDNVYDYFKRTLENNSDIEFTSYIKFIKNNLKYNTTDHNLDATDDSENEIDRTEDSPIEDMSRSLHDDTVKFFMTHDVEVALPSTIAEDGVLKISPISFEGNGTLVKLEVLPRANKNDVGEGRIFFGKIKKFINEKLIYALLAILLVIKLLAVKFLFVLPLIVGAATAKKLLLKILLFVFPALHHLFKFCAYYPIQAKYHHHKHLISHIHKVAPQPPHHYDHHEGPPPDEYVGPEYGPPTGHHEHSVGYHEEDAFNLGDGVVYDSHGSGFSPDVISHRHDPTYSEYEPGWGPQGPVRRPSKKKRPLSSSDIEKLIAKAEREAAIKARLQQEKLRIREENLRLQEQLNEAIKFQEKLKYHAAKLPPGIRPKIKLTPPEPVGPHFGPPNRPHNVGSGLSTKTSVNKPFGEYPNKQVENVKAQNPADAFKEESNPHGVYIPQHVPEPPTSHQSTQIKTSQPEIDPRHPVYRAEYDYKNSFEKTNQNRTQQKPKIDDEIYQAASITYDPFYTPILEKVDKVLTDLGFDEEPCKERLICSMYKNPERFSPHSNLVSTEISRDANELQKPTSANAAVVRFYKYVQAARDGQDGRDCLRLYPTCSINTEL